MGDTTNEGRAMSPALADRGVTPERFASLPKWARATLDVIARDVEYWKAKATAGPDQANTFAGGYTAWRPLGVGERVRFFIDGQHGTHDASVRPSIEVYVATDDYDGKRVALRSTGGGLAFLPQASNAAFAVVVPRG